MKLAATWCMILKNGQVIRLQCNKWDITHRPPLPPASGCPRAPRRHQPLVTGAARARQQRRPWRCIRLSVCFSAGVATTWSFVGSKSATPNSCCVSLPGSSWVHDPHRPRSIYIFTCLILTAEWYTHSLCDVYIGCKSLLGATSVLHLPDHPSMILGTVRYVVVLQ